MCFGSQWGGSRRSVVCCLPKYRSDKAGKKVNMATQGPDDETWKKMTPIGRKAYWVCIAAIFFWLTYLFVKSWRLYR